MQKNTTTKQFYLKKAVPVTGDPLIIAGLLAESGLSQTYLVYENDGKWCIGIGAAAFLTVDADGTRLEVNGQYRFWDHARLSDSIASALDTLPIDGWRAYGIANFEMARYIDFQIINLGRQSEEVV